MDNRDQKIFVNVPYYPQNLGRAYNNFMEKLNDDEWACFLDHDAMFTTDQWYYQLLYLIENTENAGLFTAITNNVCPKWQCDKTVKGHNIVAHRKLGGGRLEKEGGNVTNITVTKGGRLSGVLMLTSKEAWKKAGGFIDGFYGVDNAYHTAVATAGYGVYFMKGLYVYHWYRGKE